MPYVHLANGDVKQFDAKEFAKVFGDETPRAYRENGVEHHVIGVYPDEVQFTESEDEKNAAAEKAEFDEWKANR